MEFFIYLFIVSFIGIGALKDQSTSSTTTEGSWVVVWESWNHSLVEVAVIHFGKYTRVIPFISSRELDEMI